MQGELLGGTVDATGGVDIAARQWFGEAAGDIELGDAARWLASGRVPFDAATLPVSGDAALELSASGWQDVSVSGQAEGAGEVAGYDLEDLQVDFGFTGDAGARADISATLAGGEVTAQLQPTEAGFDFTLGADALEVLPDLTASADVALSQADGTPTGTTNAALSGQTLGAPLNVNIGGMIAPNDLAFSVTGQALGGPLDAQARLQEGDLNLSLTGRDLNLPTLDVPHDSEPECTGSGQRLAFKPRAYPGRTDPAKPGAGNARGKRRRSAQRGVRGERRCGTCADSSVRCGSRGRRR